MWDHGLRAARVAGAVSFLFYADAACRFPGVLAGLQRRGDGRDALAAL